MVIHTATRRLRFVLLPTSRTTAEHWLRSRAGAVSRFVFGGRFGTWVLELETAWVKCQQFIGNGTSAVIPSSPRGATLRLRMWIVSGRLEWSVRGGGCRLDAMTAWDDHLRMASRRIVGCMTGTSMDAIDVALVAVDGHGLGMRASVQRCATHPLGSLAGPLRRLSFLEPASAGQIATLARDLALCHVTARGKLVRDEPIDLIAVHGQTIFHAPPVSWQLLAPAPIAEAFRVPVVFDLRAADLAAGGQGAPITPLADFVLFRDDAETRAIVNLGGFANYTILQGRLRRVRRAHKRRARG